MALLGGGKQASLDNLLYKNHKISIQLNLPSQLSSQASKEGVYKVATVTLNNKPINGVINEELLAENNIIAISFGDLSSAPQSITMAENVNPLSHTDAKVFSPEAPVAVTVRLISQYLTGDTF